MNDDETIEWFTSKIDAFIDNELNKLGQLPLDKKQDSIKNSLLKILDNSCEKIQSEHHSVLNEKELAKRRDVIIEFVENYIKEKVGNYGGSTLNLH